MPRPACSPPKPDCGRPHRARLYAGWLACSPLRDRMSPLLIMMCRLGSASAEVHRSGCLTARLSSRGFGGDGPSKISPCPMIWPPAPWRPVRHPPGRRVWRVGPNCPSRCRRNRRLRRSGRWRWAVLSSTPPAAANTSGQGTLGKCVVCSQMPHTGVGGGIFLGKPSWRKLRIRRWQASC